MNHVASKPRDAASEAQFRAARPDASTWLAANAGSGKTKVLTDRAGCANLAFAGGIALHSPTSSGVGSWLSSHSPDRARWS